MRTRSRLPLFVTLALAVPAVAQEDRSLGATLLVRCGPGDVVLNADLVEAIVQDPAVETAVKKVGGAALTQFRGIGVSLPAAHLAGTYQVELGIELHGTGEWSRETKDQIVDAVAKHLERRLSALLYEGPMRLLSERRTELADRHRKLLGEHAALRARAERADVESELVHKLGETLEQQFVAARLELATEQRANEYLEKLRTEHAARRDALLRESEAIDQQRSQLESEVGVLDQRIGNLPANGTNEQQTELAKLREQAAALHAKLQESLRSNQRISTSFTETQDMLARTLEQLPASTLVMQRARARLDSLEAERKALDARMAAGAAQRAEAAEFAAQAEQLQIDVTVCRTLLTEVQGKLGRLEPVRCELLRQN